jgi:glucose/mannose transport system substrate-binding protein
MMIRSVLWTAAAALIAAGGLASPASSEPLKAEVIHWWTSAGESAALKVFANAFNGAGGEWVDNAIAGGLAARQAAIGRIVAGDPPAANQFNISREFEDLIAKDLLADLEARATADRWREAIPETLLKSGERNGKMYALPTNVHGQNWIWYNKAVLDQAGATPPKGWGEDMFAALDKVKAAGKIPLAISGTPVYEYSVFHSILLDIAGPDIWYGIHRDRDEAALKGDALRKAFQTFQRLHTYADEGTPGRLWNAATQLVITGRAAFTAVGDWAKGEFIAAKMAPGKDYGCVLPKGVIIVGGDVFVFPKQKDPQKQAAQDLLVKVMFDKKVQKDFNALKGSVPSRTDVDMAGADACSQTAMTALRNKTGHVQRASMMVPPQVDGELRDLVSEFWNNPSMSIDEAMERYAELVLG